MITKPNPKPSVRETAKSVDRIFANLEARQTQLATSIAIVRALKAIPKKYETMPDLVKRR